MGAKQGTTMIEESKRRLGGRDQESLNALFPSSPLYNGTPDALKDDGSLGSKMRQFYQAEVLDGVQEGNTLMGSVDMDYGSATNIDDVSTGGEGKPAGPRVPNTASPGEGNGANPTSQPAIPAATAEAYGHNGDLGSVAGPSNSSPEQAKFNLTNLPAMGTSPGNS